MYRQVRRRLDGQCRLIRTSRRPTASYPPALHDTISGDVLRHPAFLIPAPFLYPGITLQELLELYPHRHSEGGRYRIPDLGNFLLAVAGTPTNTRGIIEQRVTDFLGVMKHREAAWRPQGLGDPVNASNTSSRKLGDCDFQNAALKECHAVEAHAGRLTDVYLHEHLRTLRLNLPKRLDEWAGISEIGEWNLEVLFVAHEDALSAGRDQPAMEISCQITVRTFTQACNDVLDMAAGRPDETVELFNRWVVQPLNAPNTPFFAKQKGIELSAN